MPQNTSIFKKFTKTRDEDMDIIKLKIKGTQLHWKLIISLEVLYTSLEVLYTSFEVLYTSGSM